MRQAYLLMHLAILLWGLTGILGKVITLSEELIVWYRMLFTALSLAILLLWNKNFLLPKPADLARISFIGVLISLHWVTFYAAIKASNVSVSLSCFSSLALFTSLIEPFYEKRKPHLSEVLLGIFVIAGISIIFSVQQFYAKGIILALISAFLAAWFTVLNKREAKRFDASFITFYEMLTGLIFLTALLPFYFSYTGRSFEIPGLSDTLYLLILSILCTTVAFTISMQALKKINAFTMNLSVNLEPVYSIILAIIIFNEDEMLNPGFYAGTLIILISVAFHSAMQYRHNRQKVDNYK